MPARRPSVSHDEARRQHEARRQRQVDAIAALTHLERYTADLIDLGHDTIGLPVAAEALLKAAARGQAVDTTLFARAEALARC